MTKEELIKVKHEINRSTMYSLIGRSSKKMRGISLNYDEQFMTIEMFFDEKLTEEEEEEMEYAHAEVVSDIFPQIYDGGIKLVFKICPANESILDKKGNLGWFYLRKEY
ncbi:hypothetical protein [Snodgrassella sp. ESL0253]|uniref:hypothetical protein n=1 Tax=Snodgrassella sp. ESL0253 TaxID=2705031 RepID=UPI001583F1ED|nr:hypothetical protein [Snodgrassella sp. ESL0253]NUE65640.1 hypothetical protein [Snodgrassella sp. ESL0253]